MGCRQPLAQLSWVKDRAHPTGPPGDRQLVAPTDSPDSHGHFEIVAVKDQIQTRLATGANGLSTVACPLS
jgi:hypothetical protein